MKLISQHFNFNKKQKDIDFVDINIEADNRLFINPALLDKSTSQLISIIGPEKVGSFFKRTFDLYSNGGKTQALNDLFDNSKENNSNHLGYSNGFSRGNGASQNSLSKLFDTILQTGALAKNIMIQPISILVFAHDFGPDRMSDLIYSILKKEFVTYTLQEAKKLNIPIKNSTINYGKYWNHKTNSWNDLVENWIEGVDGNPLIFTPKQIVSSQYDFSVNDYVRKAVWTWRKSYHVEKQTPLVRMKHDKNGNIEYLGPTNKTLREEEIDKPFKNHPGKWKLYALEMTIKNPKLYSQYFENFTGKGFINNNRSLSDDEITHIVKNN